MTGRISAALLPLAGTPVLFFGIVEGWIDLGGGEKDLVWVLPCLLWSMLFAVASLVCWRRGTAFIRSIAASAMLATAGVLIVAVVVALAGELGVAGRF